MIIDFFDRGWAANARGTAFQMGEQAWSYDDAGKLSCQIANALLAEGVNGETKVAVLTSNDVTAWLCVLGIWRAGGVWVPLNAANPITESVELLDAFDCEILIVHPSKAQLVAQVRTRLHKVREIIILGDVCESLPDAIPFEDWIAGISTDPPAIQRAPDDVALISPTGGTTGKPKGVMNTHRSMSVMLMHLMHAFRYNENEHIVHLAAAPMTHSAGAFSLAASARGGTVVLIPSPESGEILSTIEKCRVTEVFLPPTVIYRLLDHPGVTERNFSSLRHLCYGAAPMSLDKLKRSLAVFGPVMIEAYGQTEAPITIATLRPEEHFVDGQLAPDARLTSCGRPSPLAKVSTFDAGGNQTKPGIAGEIRVRGDLVMAGYYKDEERTREAIVDGWLRTGDVGVFDDHGYLTITDRVKDMIVSGGFNIYPSEIEQVLWSHPAVRDCSVVGAPDDDWGEAVTAVVELTSDGSVTADELIALCKSRLGSVRAPKRVDFVDCLPRSNNGKVLKKDVRATYWSGVSRQI